MSPTVSVRPASFAQERFWFAHQVDPTDLSANLTWTFQIDGPLRTGALHAAVQALVARHEALRTSFTPVDGTPMQVVTDAVCLPLPLERLDSSAAGWAEAGARMPFDLTRGPLIDVRLARERADRHYLQCRFHHIIADAWSVGLILDELGKLYDGASLPPPALQYADFAAWQRDPRRADRLDEQLGFWTARLAGATPSRLARASPPAPGSVPIELPATLVGPARQAAGRHRVTLYMYLLAGFCAALRLAFPRIGVPVADRPDVALATVVGPFVNTLVLDIDASGDPTFTELTRRVRDALLDAQANQDAPFEQVVRRVSPHRGPDRSPLVDTLFVLHSRGMPSLALSGLRVTRVPTAPPPPPVELVGSLVDTGATVTGRFDYRADLHPPRTVAGLAGDFTAVLAAAGRQPDRRLSELLPAGTGGEAPAGYPTASRGPAGGGDAALLPEVCAIWAEALGVDQVGPDDDFFELGGYSLLALEILARIEERLGVKVTVREFFAHATVAELAGLIRQPDRS